MTHAYTGPMRAALLRDPLRTPGFYQSVDIAAQDYATLSEAFGTPLIIRLSDCPLTDMLSRLPDTARFGVVTRSRAEMNMTVAWATEHAYIDAPALDTPLARAGLGAKHRFFVEYPEQIDMLAKLRGRREVQPVILTLRGNRSDRGMGAEALQHAAATATAHGIPIAGLACADPIAPADTAPLGRLAAEAARICPEGEVIVIPGTYDGTLDHPQLPGYRAALARLPARLRPVPMAGRAIFARSGVLAGTVVQVCDTPDGAMARLDLALPQGFLLSEAAGALRVASTPALLQDIERPAVPCSLHSASGMEGDRFGTLAVTPRPGDQLLFDRCGAMVRSFAPTAHGGAGEVPVFLLGDLAGDATAAAIPGGATTGAAA